MYYLFSTVEGSCRGSCYRVRKLMSKCNLDESMRDQRFGGNLYLWLLRSVIESAISLWGFFLLFSYFPAPSWVPTSCGSLCLFPCMFRLSFIPSLRDLDLQHRAARSRSLSFLSSLLCHSHGGSVSSRWVVANAFTPISICVAVILFEALPGIMRVCVISRYGR